MKLLFLHYPKCSTCQKAKKWLDSNGIIYESRDIVQDNPTDKEIKKWLKISGAPIKKFFNTSGMLYREMNLKEKVAENNQEELLKIISQNGMLVKRPLLISKDFVKFGFKEAEWEEIKG